MRLLARIPTRWFNLGGFALCALLLGYAYYLQLHEGLEPCPLCIFQRVGVIALGIVFLIAGVHNPGRTGLRVYAALLALSALAGASVAARHVWLQHLPPDRIPSCGPDLGYMLQILPLAQVVKKVFTGSGECADINWTFLGLSMPEWVLAWFILLGTLALTRNWMADAGRLR
jgi:disulfide bond formation protein DsbB